MYCTSTVPVSICQPTTTIANTLSIVIILKRGRLVRLSAYSFQLQYNLLPAKLFSAINICNICFIYNLLKYYKYCGKSVISNYFLFRILGTVLLLLLRILGSTVPLPYYSLSTTVLLLDLVLFFRQQQMQGRSTSRNVPYLYPTCTHLPA